MMYIKKTLIALFITLSISMSFAVLSPVDTLAQSETATKKTVCTSSFLGFPAWYRGLLTDDGKCNIKSPGDLTGGLSSFIWIIVLNCLDIALMFVGYLSVGFIIYGGFLMLTSRGSSSDIAEAQTTIRNAVIGLIIAFGSVAVVSFVSGGIK